MSALRDIRLLVARHLDQPASVRMAVSRVLLALDLCLDANGFENPQEVEDALRALDRAVVGADTDVLENDDDDVVVVGDVFVSDWVDIDGFIDEEDDDEA